MLLDHEEVIIMVICSRVLEQGLRNVAEQVVIARLACCRVSCLLPELSLRARSRLLRRQY